MLRALLREINLRRAPPRTSADDVRRLIVAREFEQAREAIERVVATPAVKHCLIGEVLFYTHDDTGAERSFRAALLENPALPDAHYGLSLLQAEDGRLDDAFRHIYFASARQPNEARFLAHLGYCQLRLGNTHLALQPLRRAAVLAPGDAHVHNNLGIVLMAKGSWNQAVSCFEKALKLRPDWGPALQHLEQAKRERDASPPSLAASDKEAFSNRSTDVHLLPAQQCEQQGDLPGAITAVEALASARPDDAVYSLELNRLYELAGDPLGGIGALEAFRVRHPDSTDVLLALAVARLEREEFREAEALLRSVVSTSAGNGKTYRLLAQALIGQERFDDAAEALQTALAFSPDDLDTRSLWVSNLINQCRFEEAMAAYGPLEALGLHSPAIGSVLMFLGRIDEARQALDASLQKLPNDHSVRFYRAFLSLLTLDFERGWADYSARFYGRAQDFRTLPFELWRGESLQGKRVLLLAEQGVGDQIMFASCVPDLLAQQPAELVIESLDRIRATLARTFPQCRVIPSRQRGLDWLQHCGPIDCYVPLGDLPGHFRRSLQSFPRHSGYLKADPARVAWWRSELRRQGPGPYIGFSWKGGGPTTRPKLRTVDPMLFAPLRETSGGTWVCLQYGQVQAVVDEVGSKGFAMAYWPQAIQDLDDFAALVDALDLVITVCNTTVHFAGALGRPVWVATPWIPEWRYGLTNESIPWYPSSRQFRQREWGDWDDVFCRIKRELSQWLTNQRPP